MVGGGRSENISGQCSDVYCEECQYIGSVGSRTVKVYLGGGSREVSQKAYKGGACM